MKLEPPVVVLGIAGVKAPAFIERVWRGRNCSTGLSGLRG